MLNIEKNKLAAKDYLVLTIFIRIFAVSCILITLFALFYPPMPGVADQGDFQRVMTIVGLKEISYNSLDFNSHWFRYATTEYAMTPLELERLIGIIPTTSMIYPITLARIICKMLGFQYFTTKVLALIYSLMYILSLYMCVKYIPLKRVGTHIFLAVLSLFILMDGGYLIWFNSLYGEPMMILGLLFFTASVLYFLQNTQKISLNKASLIFIAAFLFLGAKMQCFSALPIIILLILRIPSLGNRFMDKLKILLPISCFIFLIVFYVKGIYSQINSTCGVDTQYNSVFYGILKNSADPKKDLKILGLPEDMAVESGKHAYLPKNEYTKYTPGSPLTKNVFNKNIDNLKLLKFYLLQPTRLIDGMKYTAAHCFDTKTSLGKYEKSDIKKYTPNFNRFTMWSDFRNSKLPKNLSFLVSFYALIVLVSVIEYIKRRNNRVEMFRIELLWTIMLIGLLQFPMPYIGNGEADTAKQLFLFNYTFDILFLVSCTWIFDKCYLLFPKFLRTKL